MARVPPPKHGQWKKGQSGNPKGRAPDPPGLKRIKNLTKAEMVEIGSMVLKGSVDELRAIAKDPDATALKCMIAAVAVRTISKGDPHALDILLNRLIGKVKAEVEITGEDGAPIQGTTVILNIPSNQREQQRGPEDRND